MEKERSTSCSVAKWKGRMAGGMPSSGLSVTLQVDPTFVPNGSGGVMMMPLTARWLDPWKPWKLEVPENCHTPRIPWYAEMRWVSIRNIGNCPIIDFILNPPTGKSDSHQDWSCHHHDVSMPERRRISSDQWRWFWEKAYLSYYAFLWLIELRDDEGWVWMIPMPIERKLIRKPMVSQGMRLTACISAISLSHRWREATSLAQVLANHRSHSQLIWCALEVWDGFDMSWCYGIYPDETWSNLTSGSTGFGKPISLRVSRGEPKHQNTSESCAHGVKSPSPSRSTVVVCLKVFHPSKGLISSPAKTC